MKKAFVILALLCSINAFSQDTLKTQRLSLGIGPTWGSLGWGANANVSYALSKKFSLKLKGVLGEKKGGTYQTGYGPSVQNGRRAFDISISVNYFILGNIKPTCKAGLYVGLGLSYLRYTINTINFYPYNAYPNTTVTNQEKYISQGLAGNAVLGGIFKLGLGKIYAEGYLAISFLGNSTDSYCFPNPKDYTQIQTKTYDVGFSAAGLLCFNIGYAIPF